MAHARVIVRRIAAVFAGAVVALLSAGEASVRLLGADQFPLYEKSSVYGYVPRPNQSGSFLNKNRWSYNELSMGVDRSFNRRRGFNILLIGDSIVNGGNPTDQSERLGPLLEKATDASVWPISAGSWALLNELAWIESHSSVIKDVDKLVFVLNSADFGRPSVWQSDTGTPTESSISSFWTVARKYFDLSPEYPLPPDLADPRRDWTSEWQRKLRSLRASVSANILIVIYPDRAEAADSRLRQANFEAPLKILSDIEGIDLLIIADDPEWRADTLYRDSIHPNTPGTKLLASIIAQHLPR